MGLSKSKFQRFYQCPKMLWMDTYMPEKAEPNEALQRVFDNGHQVGVLAANLFGPYKDATVYDKEGKLDIATMIIRTQELLLDGASIICEAAFSFNGSYCAVDILRKTTLGYEIYEVKSSTKIKPIFLVDVAYQKYILANCGINVKNVFLVTINNDYEKCGDLNLTQLFNVNNVNNMIQKEFNQVERLISEANSYLANSVEPKMDLHESCDSPYECVYYSYCSRHLPKPSVFDLYRLNKKTKFEYYRKGIISFEDLVSVKPKLNQFQKKQIDYYFYNKSDYIDMNGIESFLIGLHFPLYFLDFETYQQTIPLFDGIKPYQQIPFQYSIHYITELGESWQHIEFLANPGVDPRRELAENLIKSIPKGACVIAYNASFEQNVIKELARRFPDISAELMQIHSSIKDLMDVFTKGYYYNKDMGGSLSIKSVLPALFPDNPDLNYINLNGIHNGTQASAAYANLPNMSLQEQEITRRDMLLYCKLDTLAMAYIWLKLVELIEKNKVV